MSHQAYFYMTTRDANALEKRLRAQLEFVILRRRSLSSTPQIVESLTLVEKGELVWDLFLVRPLDMNAVVMDHIQKQGYWTLEYECSPVVQFSGSLLVDDALYRGRVYYSDESAGPNGERLPKNDDFRRWAKQVVAIVKKTLKPLEPGKRFTDYIGEDAANWQASGGKLVDM